MDRVKGDIKNIIQSVTILSVPKNNLSKGQIIEYLLKKDKEKLISQDIDILFITLQTALFN